MLVTHTIAPVYDASSRVLLLGSIPSPKSRAQGFFYGHPQNRLWRVLANVLHEATPESNEEKRAFLLQHHIAMWDVIASCEIKGASDSSISKAQPNDLSRIFEAADICAVFTTGRTAWKYYMKWHHQTPFYLPSPSAANCAMHFEELCFEYQIIAKMLLE